MLTVALLRQARNRSQAAVMRLPSEILAGIFQTIVYAEPSQRRQEAYRLGGSRHTLHVNRVVPLSHVSSYWRAVALSTSHLWRRLVTCRVPNQWREVYVERSGCLPLDIEICERGFHHGSGHFLRLAAQG